MGYSCVCVLATAMNCTGGATLTYCTGGATLPTVELIIQVPDRGGRPSSIPPPPEMPSFQQRKPDAPRGGE